MQTSKSVIQWLAAFAVTAAFVTVHAETRSGARSRWEAAGEMLAARAGACAVALKDGRVLVSGGRNESGVLSSAEVIWPDGSSEPAPAMSFARAGHVCVALADGSILVAGGRSHGDASTPSAERFDPATGQWESVGWLSAPRAGATASLLRDGRVVIAGGEYNGALLPTIEVYDPATREFSVARGTLQTPRLEHAAAVLRDGRVVIAGGTDGKAALDSIEVFVPATGEVVSGGRLSSPRAGLSATALLDGRVFFAGGSNGETELATTETWDPATGRAAPAAPMDLPRRGHLAFRVPDNNSVLIFGGAWKGEPLPSSGIYVPWRDSWEPMERIAAAVSGAAGAALSGKVVLAGGAARSAASQQLYSTELPTIRTDKEDYAPGEAVTITGANWLAGARVDLVVKNVATGAVRWQRTGESAPAAGADGKLLVENAFVMTSEDLGQTFSLTATEQSTGRSAQTWTFTDGNVKVATSPAGITATISYQIFSVQGQGNNTTCLGTPSSTGSITASSSETTIGGVNPNESIRLTAAPTSSQSTNFMYWKAGSSNTVITTDSTFCAPGPQGNFTYVAVYASVPQCTQPQIGTHPQSQTVLVGGSVTFSVTATGTAPLSYQWRKNGIPISGATGSSYTISSVTTADAGSYDVVVSNACGSATSNAATLTVNKRQTSLTLTLNLASVVIGQESTVTVTVTDTSPDPKQTPAGTITLSSSPSGVSFGTCTLSGSGGTATCTTTASAAAAGSYNITATFAETAVHQASNDSKTLTVTKRTTKLTLGLNPASVVIGQESTVTVTVEDTSPDPKQTPTGTITLSSSPSGVTFGTCTLSGSGGTATCTTTASASAAGTYDITAKFAETPVHQESSDTKTLTVTKRTTKLTLGLNLASVVIGQDSTVTVTVEDDSPDPKQTPTGTITLSSSPSGVTFGTCTLSGSGGTASCTTTASASAAGTYNITAAFAETAVHQASNDTKTLEVKKRRTSTTVSLSPSPVDEGGTVTVTVTVKDIEEAGTKFTPDGTVSVTSAESSLAFDASSCTLSGTNESASCKVTLTAKDGPKTATITATFAESTRHLGSTGSETLEVRNVAPTIGTVTGLTADPLPVGTTLNVSAPFTDPGELDTHTCTVTWDDGMTPVSGTVSESNGNGTCTASMTFTSAGVYKVTIQVTDKDGGTAKYEFQYVVIYDPSAGFVTGGGWILSPQRAYAPDPTLTGKATFGFVSKYRKGANTPEGNTEFQFHAAQMNFRSTAYQWLVVAGAKAQFKGFGTINGTGNYGFLLTATDGQINGGGGVDKFRIKIWDTGSGTVVYDNAMGASDDIDAANPQAISGGSIVIHSR